MHSTEHVGRKQKPQSHEHVPRRPHTKLYTALASSEPAAAQKYVTSALIIGCVNYRKLPKPTENSVIITVEFSVRLRVLYFTFAA